MEHVVAGWNTDDEGTVDVAGVEVASGLHRTERSEYLRGLKEDILQARLQFSDMAGTPYAEPLVNLMQHLVNHGTYHRGQVTTMLRQLGGETVSLDMLYFFREGG